MESSIRLFKALPIPDYAYAGAPINRELSRRTLRHGYVFDPSIAHYYRDTDQLIKTVETLYGRNATQLNESFHKSFAKVRDASIEQLVYEQIMHYLSTYGAERAGTYHPDSVFVPREALEVPDLDWDSGTRVVVIRGLTPLDMKGQLLTLLGSGVALAEQTLLDAIDVAQNIGFNALDLHFVKNNEAKVALCDHFGIVPDDAVSFLRFLVYKATEKTLLIRDQETLDKLAGRSNHDLVKYFDQYEKAYGLAPLGRIFLRFKPIFLAMRTNSALRRKINRIRRVAAVEHRPMNPDLLNTLTARVKADDPPSDKELFNALAGASVFRKARLAQALKLRTSESGAAVYRVRNGKTWAKAVEPTSTYGMQRMYDKVMESLIADVAMNVSGKTILIPPGLVYGLPTTEKQFIGNFPAGTKVVVDKGDLVCGIHWTNQGKDGRTRIDLDLSMTNNLGKIGWDGAYRTDSMWFSGDLTDAPLPHGASEVFRLSRGTKGVWLMNVNYYNMNYSYDPSPACPFRIMAGGEVESMEQRRVIDPNQMIGFAADTLDVKAKTLGMAVSSYHELAFYFVQAKFQQSRSAKVTAISERVRKFMIDYYTNSISLNDVLLQAGAHVIGEPLDGKAPDVDLSCEAVTKNSLLELVRK